MIITMDGEYAYRNDPMTPVRVLCVDRPTDYPVATMSEENGRIVSHLSNGTANPHRECAIDLVPLQRKPREWWLNMYPSGMCTTHRTEDDADAVAGAPNRTECIHIREVLDEGGDV